MILILIALVVAVAGCAPARGEKAMQPAAKVRLGYFANVTHAQALLGVSGGRFARATGLPVVTKVFSSGPSAITALLAGEIDLLYVGPSPAVNGYIRSRGEALRIIAGAASGGAVLAVRPGVDPQHLEGARLGTPGIANTQDIALRYMISQQGLRTREQGGSVRITPAAPADLLNLFRQGELDAAWVAEPWGARLVHEAGATIAIDERDLWPGRRFATTVLVASTPFLQANREVVKAFLAEHVAITRELQENQSELIQPLQKELARLQGRPLPDEIMRDAISRIDFVTDPLADSVREQARRAYRLGYLGAREPDLSGLFDLELMGEVKH